MSISPELTERQEGLFVITTAMATKISDALTAHAVTAQDFVAAVETLSQKKQLTTPQTEEVAITVNPTELAALTTPPSADNELLDELYDNPPNIFRDMLADLAKIHATMQTKYTGRQRTSPQERSLVTGITVFSNLFLVLHDTDVVTQAKGIWVANGV